MKANKASIFLFHRVNPIRDVMWDPMDPARFKFILQFLKRNYTILPLQEILEEKAVNCNKPFAAISFDDGYKDFVEYSLPIMDHLKVPSSIYLVTDCITNDRPTWTFEVDYLFYNTQKLTIDWSTDNHFLPVKFRKNKFINKQQLIAYCLEFKQFLKKIAATDRTLLIQDLFRSFNDVVIPKGLMMNWKDVIQIIQAGVEIGSHTATHPPLATLNSNDLAMELQQSGMDILNKAGVAPKVISYPVGSYNQAVKDAAKLAGYHFGLAVDYKIYDRLKNDAFEIPRIELYNEPFWKSWLRIKQYV